MKHPKVFTLKVPVNDTQYGEMIVGCSGSFRLMQALQHGFTPPQINKGQSVISYLSTQFTDRLRDFFFSKGLLRNGKEQETFGGTIMIGFRGELFHMEDSYTLIQVESNEYASGSGADFAMGSLFTSRPNSWHPKDRILEALECAASFNLQTKGPFNVISI